MDETVDAGVEFNECSKIGQADNLPVDAVADLIFFRGNGPRVGDQLLQTETDLAGNKRTSRGNEYVNEEWRLFFSGPSEWDAGDGTFVPVDGSPMEFIFPGEPGFLKTQPIYDCDAVMSEAAPVGGEVVRARY